MLLHRLGERAEDDALLRQLVLEGGGDGDAVEHRVHGHAGEHLLLVQRDAELLVGLEQLRIHLVQALGRVVLGLGRRIVGDGLVVDGRVVDVGPSGLLHAEPVSVGPKSPFEQEGGLFLLGRDERDDVLVQPRRDGVRFHVGIEAVLVLLPHQGFDGFVSGGHNCLFTIGFRIPAQSVGNS